MVEAGQGQRGVNLASIHSPRMYPDTRAQHWQESMITRKSDGVQLIACLRPQADTASHMSLSLSLRVIREAAVLRDDTLLAGDGVPHAGSAQRVHALYNDKWCFLQSHNTQVVILLLFSLWTHPGPHVVLHLQGFVFPLPHLHKDKEKTQKPHSTTQWPRLSASETSQEGKQPQPNYIEQKNLQTLCSE